MLCMALAHFTLHYPYTAIEMHLVQRFSIARIPFAVQITYLSSANLRPFMNSFSLGNKKKSLGAKSGEYGG